MTIEGQKNHEKSFDDVLREYHPNLLERMEAIRTNAPKDTEEEKSNYLVEKVYGHPYFKKAKGDIMSVHSNAILFESILTEVENELGGESVVNQINDFVAQISEANNSVIEQEEQSHKKRLIYLLDTLEPMIQVLKKSNVINFERMLTNDGTLLSQKLEEIESIEDYYTPTEEEQERIQQVTHYFSEGIAKQREAFQNISDQARQEIKSRSHYRNSVILDDKRDRIEAMMSHLSEEAGKDYNNLFTVSSQKAAENLIKLRNELEESGRNTDSIDERFYEMFNEHITEWKAKIEK